MTHSAGWFRALLSGARRTSCLLVTLPVLALAACDDGPAEPADIDVETIVGTWELESPTGSFFLDISSDTIRSYSSQNDACFFVATFAIEDVDGRMITLSNGEIEFEARFRLDGETLIVDGQEFEMSDADLATLDLCDPPAEGVCTDLPELSEPDTVDGTLTNTDLEDVGGFFYDVYAIRPATATSVTIELRSTSFDSYLILLDEDGDPIGSDDDSGAAGEDARLIASLDAGCYMVMATSFGAGETGAYIITLN